MGDVNLLLVKPWKWVMTLGNVLGLATNQKSNGVIVFRTDGPHGSVVLDQMVHRYQLNLHGPSLKELFGELQQLFSIRKCLGCKFRKFGVSPLSQDKLYLLTEV